MPAVSTVLTDVRCSHSERMRGLILAKIPPSFHAVELIVLFGIPKRTWSFRELPGSLFFLLETLSAVAGLKVQHWGDHCASVLLGNSSVSTVWNFCAVAWCKILWGCELNKAKTNSITQQLMDLNSWMPSNYIRREVCVPVSERMCVCFVLRSIQSQMRDIPTWHLRL